MAGFEGPCTVLGGLPMYAKCSSSYDPYTMEYDAEVESMHWLLKGDKPGKEITPAMYDRLHKHDTYWMASVTEQVSDYLAWKRCDYENDDPGDAHADMLLERYYPPKEGIFDGI